MRNTGKQTVVEDTYLDGKLHHTQEVIRSIYVKADGSEYIRSMGKRVPVKIAEDGYLHARFDVKTVKPIDMQALVLQGITNVIPLRIPEKAPKG